MIYNTSDPTEKAKFLARTTYLVGKGSVVEVKELRPFVGRTTKQNDCWRAWCAYMAEIVDADQEDVARDIKRAILGRRRVFNVFTGEEEEEDFRTRDMSKEEMSSFLTKVRQWAFSTYGWSLPSREGE